METLSDSTAALLGQSPSLSRETTNEPTDAEIREKLARARARVTFPPPDLEIPIVNVQPLQPKPVPVVMDLWEPTCVNCGTPIGYTTKAGSYSGLTECPACVAGSFETRIAASGIGAGEVNEALDAMTIASPEFGRYMVFLRKFADLRTGGRLDPPFAFVCGQNGVGKSAGAQRALRDAIRNGCQGRFLRLSQLLDAIYATYGGDSVQESTDERMRFFSRVHLLVIDECGGETNSEHAERRFFDIVDERWKNRLPTIFTSNYLPNESSLGVHITGSSSDPTRARRILDRIRGGAGDQVFVIKGKSWRGAA